VRKAPYTERGVTSSRRPTINFGKDLCSNGDGCVGRRNIGADRFAEEARAPRQLRYNDIANSLIIWRARRDSNRRPPGSKPGDSQLAERRADRYFDAPSGLVSIGSPSRRSQAAGGRRPKVQDQVLFPRGSQRKCPVASGHRIQPHVWVLWTPDVDSVRGGEFAADDSLVQGRTGRYGSRFKSWVRFTQYLRSPSMCA
jgi:hypothetical protein